MQDAVRSPRLLDADLQEARRLKPTALSLSLNRRSVSTAQITLPGEDEALPLMGFVEIYLRRGSAGIFRVKEISQAAKGSNTRTYALSHAVSTLHDSVWRAQEDFSGTVTAFLTQLLSYQQTVRWQLGTVQDTGTWKKSGINYDHLDTLLYELAADRKDYLLTFDFSTSPWTLNFVQASGQVDCEMRMRRNLSDAQARGSLEGMCNRLYLTVHSTAQSQEDETVTEPTTQLYTYNDTASQAEFGVIEDTADIDTADVPDVAAWVAAFFQEHAAPQTQTSADGYEVVKSTGEPFDQFDLGKRCRIPALQVEGPVESIRFGNLLSDPDKAQLDLNQKQQSATGRLQSLKEQARAAAASARSAGYAAKKNAADVEKHYNHVVNVTDQGMEDCFGVIGVKLDPDTHQPMKDAQGNYIWAGANDSPAEIWGHFHRTAWQTLIANVVSDGQGNVLSIGQVSTSADGQVFITAINDQQTGTATINANRILINGNMTLNGAMSSDSGMLWIKVAAKFGSAGGQMVTINDGKVNASELQVNSGGALKIVGSSSGSGAPPIYSLGYSDFSNFMTSIGTPDISNTGEFKVPYYSLGVPDGSGGSQAGTIDITHYHDITATEGTGTDAGKVFFTSGAVRSTAGTTNFNIAATQFFRDSVAARTAHSISQIDLGSGDTGQSTQTVTVYSTDDHEEDVSVTVDASDVYTAGQDIVTIVKGTWGVGSTTGTRKIDFTKSAGTQDTKSVVLSLASVQMVSTDPNQWTVTAYDGNANTGANIIVDATSRYTAGQNSVNVTKGNWNGGIISFTPSAGTGSSQNVQLAQGSASWNGNTATVPIMDGNDSTGLSVEVDATDRYNAGWGAARTSVGNFPESTPQTLPGSITVKKPSATVDGTAAEYTYTLAVDNSYVYLNNGINPVARISNPAFANGQNSVGARILDANDNVVSGTQTISSAITLYPAKKIGDTYTKNTDYALTITPSGGGSASASDINIANSGSIWVVGGWETVPPAISGNTIVDLGSLSSSLTDSEYGDSVIFRACIGPESSATSFKYYRIKVGYT